MPENAFAKDILSVITDENMINYDLPGHIQKLREIVSKHPNSKFAAHFNKLNDTEIEAMLRFCERPHGRHHIAELEKMMKTYEPNDVLRVFLKHFYEHDGKRLVHTKDLKHLFR
ncbi:MAG: hypothetical protein KAT91_01405 [Candidatus Aenigmarchaeota archaeon]|nr:hypothetical protein [Candidatus Aenigmarchaeota archaeon]